MHHKDKNQVSLATEIDFISNYIFLLQTRFSKGINIEINITDEALERGIVPVSLQILIENAVKHNALSENSPLHIKIYNLNDYIYVSNNLQKKPSVDGSNKIGLQNMKTLYQFLSAQPLLIEETNTTFVVGLPML